jgi:hypothetical protein
MTVVKFSILTLLAGGFCTLLGIGMWMGPQETSCNAQTGVTAVAVADSPAPVKSCWSQPADVAFGIDFVAAESKCANGACDSAACAAPVCSSGKCESGPCNLASAEPTVGSTSAAQAVVQRLPSPYYAAAGPGATCEPGVCAHGAPYAAGTPCSAGTFCPRGVPGPPAPTFATTSFYHVAPCAGPECAPAGYSNPYGIAPAYVSPAPVVSAYTSYREVEPRNSDQPSMEMIEAFMEEREKRYEIQVEALEAQMESKLEAQAATLQAQHQVEMIQLKAEAMVKFATMEQALREEKALLQLVADGTLTTDALRTIIAKNHANGHGAPVQPVSTAAGCACEKCACETCRCGQPGASCACDACPCEGCACPGCEQAVSTAAPACSACKSSACETSACKASACGTAATAKCGGGKSCDAASVVSVGACQACTKECEACVKACGDCKLADATLECDQLTVSADGKTCTIVVGARLSGCSNGECKGDACATAKCKGDACASGKCGACDKSVAVETAETPFVCEKDGCELEIRVSEVPILSEIPYVGRLFRNVGIEVEETGSAEQAQR